VSTQLGKSLLIVKKKKEEKKKKTTNIAGERVGQGGRKPLLLTRVDTEHRPQSFCGVALHLGQT
jgi:hypothetical protein